MSEQTADATREELTARCGHECLNGPDHDGPHFYGYRMGQYSYEGLLAENDRLRMKVEPLTEERDESDRYRAGRLVREREEWEANSLEALDEIDRLRGAIEKHRNRKIDREAIHRQDGKYGCMDCDMRLWSVLTTSEETS